MNIGVDGLLLHLLPLQLLQLLLLELLLLLLWVHGCEYASLLMLVMRE